MADSTPTVRDPGPPLGSTADPVGYVSVSWMAVAAFAVMAVFVVVLGALAVTAWLSKSPLIMHWLLVFPAAAVVLAFAARRVVRNSEGTRTGELFNIDLIDAAWWGSVVVGLVFLTYMFAIEYSIRREAEAEVVRWVGLVTSGDKDDLTRAFHRTRDPKERANIRADALVELEQRYRNEWIAFSQCDVVRVAGRNAGACEYVPAGLKEWSTKAGSVECTATGDLRCPEGVFPFQFPLRAVEGSSTETAGGRQWQLMPVGTSGYLRDEPKLTPYGWFVLELQRQGKKAAAEFIQLAADRNLRLYAAVEYAKLAGEPGMRLYTLDGGTARLGLVGMPAGMPWRAPDEAYAATARRLFKLTGNKAPAADQLKTFQNAWAGNAALTPPGMRLKVSPDTQDILAFTDAAVEVRVPVEIPLPASKSDLTTRGRLVFACTDPAALAEAKRLRAEANPAAASLAPPTTPTARYPWRLDRIESDLRPVSNAPDAPPGGPPGM